MNSINQYFKVFGFLLLTSWILSACSSSGIVVAHDPGGSAPAEELEYYEDRSKVIETARKEIGDAYQYAGNGPEKWDCSGLSNHAYQAASISLKRVSSDIAKMSKGVDLKTSQPGDLIFFEKDGRVFHVSIITERNQKELWVVHSTTSRGVVEEEIMNSSYWKPKIHKVISLAALAKNR